MSDVKFRLVKTTPSTIRVPHGVITPLAANTVDIDEINTSGYVSNLCRRLNLISLRAYLVESFLASLMYPCRSRYGPALPISVNSSSVDADI